MKSFVCFFGEQNILSYLSMFFRNIATSFISSVKEKIELVSQHISRIYLHITVRSNMECKVDSTDVKSYII